MSHTPTPETPVVKPEEEEERRRKEEERDEYEDMSAHLEKMYKAIGELTEATRSIASYLKSADDTNRGLVEAVKSEITSLREEFKKFTAGFEASTSAHKEQNKFPDSGKAQVSETGEEVTYPPEQLRERGKEMLEKAVKDIKKSVVTPRPAGIATERPEETNKVAGLITDILGGKLKSGEVSQKLREVVTSV